MKLWTCFVPLCALVTTCSALTDQSPPVPDAVLDLRTVEGVSRVAGQWRYIDAHVVDAENHAVGPDLKPSGALVKTHDIHPRMGTPDFKVALWEDVAPTDLEKRRTNGRLAFGWYTIDITIPEHVGNFKTADATIVFETVVDDYAEVWIDGKLPEVLGQSGGAAIRGWNAPSRTTIARHVTPGQKIELAVFAANGPLSDPPTNYVWIRSATLDFYKNDRGWQTAPVPVKTDLTVLDPAFNEIIAPGTRAEKLADGFSFVEGPVWVPAVPTDDPRYGGGGLGGYLLFSDPNKNVIHRWDPTTGETSIFRTKSGYSGVGGANIGEYHQPGSNGLALDPQGRLTICEHGNRRVTRLEPNGSLTVMASEFEGRRLNSPNDLVYRSDGALFFTDPPFGLPAVYEDPRKELPFSGVFGVYNGKLRLVASDLKGPNGLAFSPDEKHLYVDNWDEARKVIVRYEVGANGDLTNPTTLVDLTAEKGEICFDGLKVDSRGNIYASAPGGIRVFSSQGRPLGIIATPELPANFTFGDADRQTLYMTARTTLYRVRVGIPGK